MRNSVVSTFLLFIFSPLVLMTGCGSLHREQKEMVYVSVRETFLRDRVAELSNRVAEVTNGEPLTVLEHGRRFIKVRTPGHKVGWIEDHMVIDQSVYDAFAKLAAAHKNDQPFATATLQDELYMHTAPGRYSDHFYLLPANTEVQLLARASAPRQLQERAPERAAPATLNRPASAHSAQKGNAAASPAPAPVVPAPVMEDWWLARDAQGRTGWLLASRVYVNVPDDILQYGEGQRFIGAWKIATVYDPQANFPNHEAPEYLTLTAPLKYGLPFDFDEVRVFTWSRIHHRYETGFRLHPIAGFLPVKIFTAPTPQGPVPAFSFQIAADDNVITDPETGITRPAAPRTIEYEMIETVVKRIGSDMAPISTKSDEKNKKRPERRKERLR